MGKYIKNFNLNFKLHGYIELHCSSQTAFINKTFAGNILKSVSQIVAPQQWRFIHALKIKTNVISVVINESIACTGEVFCYFISNYIRTWMQLHF